MSKPPERRLQKPYYDDGRGVIIYHGDCRAIAPLIKGCDLTLTDPPYKHKHMSGGGFAVRKFYEGGALDGLNDFNVDDHEAALFGTSPMLVAFGSRDLIAEYAAASVKHERKFDLHAWYKTNAIPFTANTWKSDLEYIFLMWEKRPGWVQCEQSMHSKLWSSALNGEKNWHPAAKPVDLLMKYVRVLDAKKVIDPFMGSGTTLRAAKNLGREAVGIEIEERYCEAAALRLQQEVLL